MSEQRPLPPRSRATVRQVADETGLSIATVSRVLNASAHVAPHTRDRVLAALEGLGTAAPLARGGARAGVPVFVRCPYELTDYFGLIVTAIAEELASHGRPMVLDAGESSQSRHPLGQLPLGVETAGAILILPPEDADELAALRARAFPFVIIDPRTPPPPDTLTVSAAHHRGAQQLTKHLLDQGHRRFGVLAGPDEWLVSAERLSGHRAALADVGLLQDTKLVVAVPPTLEAGRREAARMLAGKARPTALVCFNDKVAVGALRAAHEGGLHVPQDLSVVGFDDSELSAASSPSLTTVRQPLPEMGRIGVSRLLRLIDGHPVDELHVELGTKVIRRESSGPAPA